MFQSLHISPGSSWGTTKYIEALRNVTVWILDLGRKYKPINLAANGEIIS